ncbi:MAG: DEAD/DEAH box helicase [Bacillota bacterium]
MPLDPVDTTETIRRDYLRYLSTTFGLKNDRLQRALKRGLEQGSFVKGPLLEATPPFKTGRNPKQLVDEGILSRGMEELNPLDLPLQRPLYVHQEEAIRKLVEGKRNVVVSTGTGSGKTEAFLIPILNHIFRQREADKLGPGVRALLLYPMNALANDQLKRLRTLLKYCPDITFGRYTGETRPGEREARELHVRMFDAEPAVNELVSREQMRRTPPHILLTNYAMLEYLLMRPLDTPFFDGDLAEDWRFIVLDEAHTYGGARGIEMAMLLRRLKDRVTGSEQGRLQCIATSATLGRGEDDFPYIARFAGNLFTEEFAWDPLDPARQDVVAAVRRPPATTASDLWGRPDHLLYGEMAAAVSRSSGERAIEQLSVAASSHGVPDPVLHSARQKSDGRMNRFLYHLLRGDENLSDLRTLLDGGPAYFEELVECLFGDSPHGSHVLSSLVDLAARARAEEGEMPLLPARYHLFVRAIEGAYLSLAPLRQLYLRRREWIEEDDHRYPVFEIAACNQCGALFLLGEVREEDDLKRLRHPGQKYFEDPHNLEYYLLLDDDAAEEVPDNEDEIVDFGTASADSREHVFLVCARCGAIAAERSTAAPCTCPSEYHHRVIRASTRKGRVHTCPGCRSRSTVGIARRFLTGRDAVASVLTTSLYQKLPERSMTTPNPAEEAPDPQDDWLPTSEVAATAVEGTARKLLIFSDSRRDAAFFATYLSRSYSRMLRRRLMIEVLRQNRDSLASSRWRLTSLVSRLSSLMQEVNLSADMGPQEYEDEAWRWVLYELLEIDARNSPEQLGLMGFSVTQPGGWMAPPPLLREPWNFTREEVWTLYQVLIRSFRRYGATSLPSGVRATDDIFSPRNYINSFRRSESNAARHIHSWVPTERYSNSRLDFLLRLCDRSLPEVSPDQCRQLLHDIWDRTLMRNPWRTFFTSHSEYGEGTTYRMQHQQWEIEPAAVNDGIQWYRCDHCHKLTLFNLRGTCPTYRCEGTLRPCAPEEVFADNHYRNLYLTLETARLKAAEHTAQLQSEAAARLQTAFNEGRVNVLSCSTTFELGVDVGDLESVFMRNVPPTPANYAQRAGRAGRRSEATAFALTYCQRRSHDLSYFEDPTRMVTGQITPPSFDLSNEKIIRRHMHSVAMAEFWKANPDMFRLVEDFFFPETDTGPSLLRQYLEGQPRNLQEMLRRIVPPHLHSSLGVDDWTWTGALLDDVLNVAAEEVYRDVTELERAREERFRAGKPDAGILRSIRTIKRRSLLNYLSSRNVLPKYGFPVDVVELHLFNSARDASDAARRLELNRDLRIALSEYAPSSQVVAGGKLWTSRYLKRLPEREWPTYRYVICQHCGHFQREQVAAADPMELCAACGNPAGPNRGTFVKPEFGFHVSRSSPDNPGESQPERTYTTRTYYSRPDKHSRTEETLRLEAGGLTVEVEAISNGRLAVLNQAGRRGFRLCRSCGYCVLGGEAIPLTHENPWGYKCEGRLTSIDLGHDYETDVLLVRFGSYRDLRDGFWVSLLYALLEGASKALDIARADLDGCLYPHYGDPGRPALVLFDDVPGGAGHVRRIARDREVFTEVLRSALTILRSCECGGEEGESSCYGCLRNYRNQYCHEELNRAMPMEFLQRLV